MKLGFLNLTLLFDYYGEFLSPRQKSCLDLYYNQDFSLSEIAEELGGSRQGVHESILRAEQTLSSLEEKIGFAARDQQCRRLAERIRLAASQLLSHEDRQVQALAREILATADTIKE